MPVAIKGSGGGSVTLDAGAAAANSTLTLPNTSGTVLTTGTAVTVAQGGTGITSTGSAGNVLFTTDGTTWSATQKIVQGTAVASTSGTSIDFTSIPSWVKRVTVMFDGVSTSGTSVPQIQIGTSSGVQTTGYAAIANQTANVASVFTTSSTTGFPLQGSTAATNIMQGFATLVLMNSSTGTWAISSTISISATAVDSAGGTKTLSGTLDRVRITTVGGTDTFDAGSINILYE